MIDLKATLRAISDLRDPFDSKLITRVSTYCSLNFDKWSYRGSIEFTNGNTMGEQKFEGSDFANLLQKMQTFVAELEAKR